LGIIKHANDSFPLFLLNIRMPDIKE